VLAEQFTAEAEVKKMKEKTFNTLEQSRSWEADSSSASQIYETLTFIAAFAWARRLFLFCFG
jgi:hypothetical protein